MCHDEQSNATCNKSVVLGGRPETLLCVTHMSLLKRYELIQKVGEDGGVKPVDVYEIGMRRKYKDFEHVHACVQKRQTFVEELKRPRDDNQEYQGEVADPMTGFV